MATFISTIRFTDQGAQGIQQSPQRAQAFKAQAKKLGVKVSAIYWTLGAFDGVLIFDAPDDESATAAMLALSSAGNVHTTTCRAFGANEFAAIVGKING